MKAEQYIYQVVVVEFDEEEDTVPMLLAGPDIRIGISEESVRNQYLLEKGQEIKDKATHLEDIKILVAHPFA